jgi:hypothetical protein
MAINPPYRFDPLQNVVNVSWFAADYLTVTMEIDRSPTLDFQRTMFARQTTDTTQVLPLPFPLFPEITVFRWIWRRQSIILIGPYSGPSIGGQWTECKDAEETAFGQAQYANAGGSFAPLENDVAAFRFEGIPELPIEDGGASGALSAIGSVRTRFWPAALWDNLSGAVYVDPDRPSTDLPPAPNSKPFRVASSATIRLWAWTHADEPFLGFVPEGGWIKGPLVPTVPEPTESFSPYTVDMSALRIWRNGRAWRYVAAALDQQPGPFEEGYVLPFYSRTAGQVWMLFKRDPANDEE